MFALCLVLWIGFVLTLFTLSLLIIPNQAKARIRAYLAGRGAHNIMIAYHWFGRNRVHYTYTVSYQDATGVFHDTNCILSATLFGDRSIYWLDGPQIASQRLAASELRPIQLLSMPAWSPETDYTALSVTAKDQLIRELLNQNEQLRLELHRIQVNQA